LKLFKAFVQLIRWKNLLFIILTQVIFLYCIYLPFFNDAQIKTNLSVNYFFVLILIAVCIAAAGNIINDYFDYKIDVINKPNKVIVHNVIAKKWVLCWYIFLSVIGIVLSYVIDVNTHVNNLVWANSIAVLLLFLYAVFFKKQFLVGNLLISILTAWVILVISFCEIANYQTSLMHFFNISFLYAGFALLISLIREVVKDMEDIQGDKMYNCKTMPIVLGIKATKTFVIFLSLLLVAIIVFTLIYFYQLNWTYWIGLFYTIIFILLPLCWFIIQLPKVHTPTAFHKLSSLIKLVMLTGILTIVLFKL
jgi:4-hydroxybenzoate polyprenyltransferase